MQHLQVGGIVVLLGDDGRGWRTENGGILAPYGGGVNRVYVTFV